MIYIEHYSQYCDISAKYPITDKDVDKLIAMNFGDLIKTGNIIDKDKGYVGNGISLEEFIETKLTPEQKEKIQNYIYRELEKLNNRFLGPSRVKSARSTK